MGKFLNLVLHAKKKKKKKRKKKKERERERERNFTPKGVVPKPSPL